MSEVTVHEQKPWLFAPGKSGNPAGRPKGSRNKLAEAFVADLHEDWQEHGKAVIQAVRAEKPDQYLKVIASIIPKDVNLNVNTMEDLTDDELRQRIADLAAQLAPFLGDPALGNGSGGQDERGTSIAPRVH